MMSPDYKGAPWDRDAFLAANNWDTRKQEVTSFAKALKSEAGFKKVGTIGFCWGGGAVLKLGAKGLFCYASLLRFGKWTDGWRKA